MRRGQPTLPIRFATQVTQSARRECDEQTTAAIEGALRRPPPPRLDTYRETQRYFALCERAWLQWTRVALDSITRWALQQASSGTFTPATVRNAEQARQAEARCQMHRRMLEALPDDLDHPGWPWRLEAARHVHASTQRALRIGAGTDPLNLQGAPRTSGIAWAADALVIAISARFIADVAAEIHDTLATIESA